VLEVVGDEGLFDSAQKTAKLKWASRDVDSVLDETEEPSSDSDGQEDIAGSSAQVRAKKTLSFAGVLHDPPKKLKKQKVVELSSDV
jgi:hypothetical protein